MKEIHFCPNEESLLELGRKEGERLQGGEIFALNGDLGLGKTTFVKGVTKGLGSPALVTSPTFNLVHRYAGGRLELIHYDLYRLKKIEELEALDLESNLEEKNVIAIEWPDLAMALLPSSRTQHVSFVEKEDGREVTIETF